MRAFFKNKKVLVTGGAGFIGSHLVHRLVELGAVVTVVDNLSRGEKDKIKDVFSDIAFYAEDLRDEKKTQRFFNGQEIVFNLAALNTGIDFDKGRTEVMFEENLLLQMMPIRMANKAGVRRFIQISSASVYSTEVMENKIPTSETMMEGEPEESKLGYALAKRVGEYLAQWYFHDTGMETIRVRFINVYGENDNYDEMGHFIPVMVRKFIDAKKEVLVFGSGKQKRSFLYVKDAVEALLVLANKGVAGEVYNVDSSCEKSIFEVVNGINEHFKEKKLKIKFDLTKPEGSKRRLLDSTKLKKLGWKPKAKFDEALKNTVIDIKTRTGSYD